MIIRELSFFFRSRPNFVEFYPDRITGQAKKIRGPGPARPYFSIPLDKAKVYAGNCESLIIYQDGDTFICYAGGRAKEMEKFITKHQKSLPATPQ